MERIRLVGTSFIRTSSTLEKIKPLFDVDFLRSGFVKSNFFDECVVKMYRKIMGSMCKTILFGEYGVENEFDHFQQAARKFLNN